MTDELMALLKNNTWSLVPLPPGRTPIGYKWVFKVKENPNGSIQKCKARLVAKGFHQVAGFDFIETFSPIVKPATTRVMLTIALSRGWLIHQLDVNNAFLNGVLHEEVFIEQPLGFIQHNQSHLVCKLHKSLYGLKQAPRAWFEKLSTTLYAFGFISAKSDRSLFIRVTKSHSTYILVYVDDILITGSSEQVVMHLITSLNREFALKDLREVNYFLGIEVNHTSEGIHLSQGKYITDPLCKAKIQGVNPISTRMTSG